MSVLTLPPRDETDASSLGGLAVRLVEDLAALTDEPGRLTRLFLSPAHRRAANCVAQRMAAVGLAVSIDAVGTVVGRYEGERPGLPALLLGSHLDTVRDAGRFDGMLGVAVALAVVAALARDGHRLPFAIEILAFGDEEGVRFPSTLAGSRAIAGRFDMATLDGCDGDGVSLEEALRAFGCNPAEIPAIARRPQDVLGYIELHIEQGTILERANQGLGLVSGISGAMRLRLGVAGRSGHAGTLTMAERRDALCGAAEMVLAIESVARGRPDLVATVGRISVEPGAVNVVPGHAEFTLDLRTLGDIERAQALAEILDRCREIADRRDLGLRHETVYDQATTLCDAKLKAGLAGTLARHGLAPVEMQSGAGHDGLAVAALCPIAMLFVRCTNGISHHPDENVRPDDIELACAVLHTFLLKDADHLLQHPTGASHTATGKGGVLSR